MAKTILKLHANGDLETIDTTLVQSRVIGNYSFSENSIIVPQIVQYPSSKNYFIEKDSVEGYLDSATGGVQPSNEGDRTSDYINVLGWSTVTIRIRFTNLNGLYNPWVAIHLYTAEKYYYNNDFDDYVGTPSGDYVFERKISIPEYIVAFLRVSANYYDTEGVNVQICVEQGDTLDTGHHVAIEDMADWAVDTDNPISMFPQGVIIKGRLIQTNTQ